MNQLAEYRAQQRARLVSSTPPSYASSSFRILHTNASECTKKKSQEQTPSTLSQYIPANDKSKYPLANILKMPTDASQSIYTSKRPKNIDILLEYQGATDESTFTLTHLFIAGSHQCDSNVTEGLVWLWNNEDLPADLHAKEAFLRDALEGFNDCTEEQFAKIQESPQAPSTPSLFFRTDPYELTYLHAFSPQWKSIKYIRIKLLRGATDKNIDLAHVGPIGYSGTTTSQAPEYRDIPHSLLPLETEPLRVKPFRYYTREFTKPCLVVVCRQDDLLLQQLCAAAPNQFLSNTPIRRMFYVNASKENWMFQTAFAVRVANVKFENEAYIVQQDPDTKEEVKYRMGRDLTVANVQQFVEEFAAGKLQPFTRRQTVQDAYNEDTNMWTLTWENFAHTAEQSTEYDTAVLFYASDLAEVFPTSEWEQLALLVRGVKGLRVCMYDLTQNDIPNGQYTMGVYLVGANTRAKESHAPIRFNQKDAQTNNFFDYIRFINENARRSEQISVDGDSTPPAWQGFNLDSLPTPHVRFIVPRSGDDNVNTIFKLHPKQRSMDEVNRILAHPSVERSSDQEKDVLGAELSKAYLQWGTSGRIVWLNEQMNALMKRTIPEIAKVLLNIDDTLAAYSLRTIRQMNVKQKGAEARYFALRHPQVERDFVVVFLGLRQGSKDDMQDEPCTIVAQLENTSGMDSRQFWNYVMVMIKCVEVEGAREDVEAKDEDAMEDE